MISENIKITWLKFVKEFEGHREDSGMIFRGHSNENGKTWQLVPSFHRKYRNFNFGWSLSRQFKQFHNAFNGYQYINQIKLAKMSELQRIYYLQHYEIPTCFLDFTKDPLVALYFSLSDIETPQLRTFNSKGNAHHHNDLTHVSIYQIDIIKLQNLMKIKNITECNGESFSNNYFQYEFYDNNNRINAYIGIDLVPEKKFKDSDENYNLIQQKGVFLLYDNQSTTPMGRNECLIEFLTRYFKINNIEIDKPLIKIYEIEYNDLYDNINKQKGSVFSYLKSEDIYGAKLFNDIQGIKYDFTQIDHY